ncbi:MAG: NAD-dependent epimerase/dehydratase family protein [bacterium]|nr:NAD-dependent epimerase/dehydratase family protein [bacterium]
MKETCLVFGGGGFIGSHLCEELLARNFNVTIFDKINFSKKNISGFIDDVKIIEGDFNNEIDIKNSLDNIDYVFHLVSSTVPATSNENPVYDVETNLVSSLKLFQECVRRKIRKVIFLSSGGTVYGIPDELPVRETSSSNPICSYGIVKKTIEEYLFMFEKLYGLDYFVFRLSNPYGEKQNPFAAQGAIPVFINKVINNEPITIWGDGSVERDYIYIKDAVNVLASSVAVKADKKIFNLSSGTGTTLNELIEIIKNFSGKSVEVIYKDGRSIDVPVNVLDNTLTKKIFAWSPQTDLGEGMKRVYKYLSETA